MTNPVSLTLQGVCFQLPDGRALLSDLHEVFDDRRTGLVGRNGVGKSVLARILAGELSPTAGRCLRQGRVHYLAQQAAPQPGQTVAGLAGMQDAISALQRIEGGSTRQEDFDAVGERWNLRERLQQELAASGLRHLRHDTPAVQLSGGEAMRAALAGAFLSEADVLILDEPSNHLDREHRQALRERLQRWTGGLIVVSHDRELLETLERIVELSALGLHSYGGAYGFYVQTRAEEREKAQAVLDHRKAERRREERALLEQRERLEQRLSRGARQAAWANQAPILLGRQKERSEASSGRLRARQGEAREALAQRVRDAAEQVEESAPVVLFPPGTFAAPACVAELDDVRLPQVKGPTRHLSLKLLRGQRVALTGPNGCGKSTLLRVLAGLLQPMSGRCERQVEAAYLDQHFSVLDPEAPLLAQMLADNPKQAEGELRSRLALLGLDAERVQRPSGLLSGGERMKAALARVIHTERPVRLLLLDEPGNHLDLASLQALEAMLRQYPGTLVVVSHDETSLGNLQLTHRLEPGPRGWAMREWTAADCHAAVKRRG
jgi:ATPase subunit of ABC transporter with duplicated ATPase domains